VEAGSKYENKENNGLSHFLEHMCFKGTAKRPSNSAISEELDSIGSHYNAFTSQEYTGYFAKAQFGHLDKLLDVISDMGKNQVYHYHHTVLHINIFCFNMKYQ
jgi:predicted Zn-dependent peptidase